MANDIVPYRQPPPRVVVIHHVHHVRVEHHDAGNDDAAELRWQLKVIVVAFAIPTAILWLLLGFEIATHFLGG